MPVTEPNGIQGADRAAAAAASAPKVSVIVPVHNRRDLLARTLEALDRQSFDDFELIVVDDGSEDGAGALAEATPVRGRKVRVIRHDRPRGAVAARQAGVAAAQASILAFTDSDCRPAPEWLEKGVAAIDAGADIVDGFTKPARPVGPLERSVYQANDGLYATCNVFYRRSSFESAGGFDRDAGRRWGFRLTGHARGTGFGEDTLLGWRMARAGPARYEPDAVVEHHVFPADLRHWLDRATQVGQFPALIRECPELRRTFIRRWIFFGSRSRAPVYVTVAAACLRRPGLATLALAWWARVRWRDVGPAPAPLPRRLALLGGEMAVDAVCSVTLAMGSVRHRTVAL